VRVINEEMTNNKAQMPNQAQNPPLKVRGARGVMRIMEVTPFIPLILRGKSEGRGNFGI
jgi:hypothetical protein